MRLEFILLMSHTLLRRVLSWMRKPKKDALRHTLSIRFSQCCHLCCARNFAPLIQMLIDQHIRCFSIWILGQENKQESQGSQDQSSGRVQSGAMNLFKRFLMVRLKTLVNLSQRTFQLARHSKAAWKIVSNSMKSLKNEEK